MGGDLPDYTRTITVLLRAEILSQVRQLPWWVRYNPSRVVFLDDMEGVLKWIQGSGTVAKSSIINAFEQSNCLTMTTGATAGNESQAYITLGGISRSKIGLQLRWNAYNADPDTLRLFEAMFIFYDEDGSDEILLRYLHTMNGSAEMKWQYYDENGNVTDIPNGDESVEIDMPVHHSLYFTADLNSPYTMGRLVTSGLDMDISNLKHRHYVGGAPPHIEVSLRIVTDKDVAAQAAIDAVLISDMEP